MAVYLPTKVAFRKYYLNADRIFKLCMGILFTNAVVGQRTRRVDEKFCCDCGANIDAKAEVCPKCGIWQRVSQELVLAANKKSRVTAAVLAFFLGGLGVHKFYLGKIGMGILYLLFFWTIIPAIIALIDFIILLCMTEHKFDSKYNRA